jgi:hypothetical protein
MTAVRTGLRCLTRSCSRPTGPASLRGRSCRRRRGSSVRTGRDEDGVLDRSLALDEDEVRAQPDDVVTRFYRRHCDPAGNFSTALASICTYTDDATWRDSRDFSGSSLRRTHSTEKKHLMASPATFRAPYLQRLELVNDIIRADPTLRGKGCKRFGVTSPARLNPIRSSK